MSDPAISQATPKPRNYPQRYIAELQTALEGIDPDQVSRVVDVFREARMRGRRIFVCGDGASATMASQFLCEMVKGSSLGRPALFRIIALSAESPGLGDSGRDSSREEAFVEQLESYAQPGDVVVGISPSGNSANVLRALEHAARSGCRTISLTGGDGGRLARLANFNILVRSSQRGPVEDAHIAVCHMIGHYFLNLDAA